MTASECLELNHEAGEAGKTHPLAGLGFDRRSPKRNDIPVLLSYPKACGPGSYGRQEAAEGRAG